MPIWALGVYAKFLRRVSWQHHRFALHTGTDVCLRHFTALHTVSEYLRGDAVLEVVEIIVVLLVGELRTALHTVSEYLRGDAALEVVEILVVLLVGEFRVQAI